MAKGKKHSRSKSQFRTARAAWSDVAEKTGLRPMDVTAAHTMDMWVFIEK